MFRLKNLIFDTKKLILNNNLIAAERSLQNCNFIRSLSSTKHSIVKSPISPASKDEIRELMNVWPEVVSDLKVYTEKYESNAASKWFVKCLQYNVPNGKKNRGLATVLAYKMLASKEDLTDENIRLAHLAGWCVEMIQSTFLIVDDIMDNSKTRRGNLCWYRRDEVGLSSINDSMMIESGIYHLLKKYFSTKEYYVDILELFHEITFITTVGQHSDLETAKKRDVSTFTMEKYKSIVCNKTSYYSFYLPVALAMHMAGYKDAEMYRQTKTILLEAGQFFQAQDDFIDCFGDPEVSGKIGTDIQDGKCSWLAVVALQRCTDKQRQVMLDCYGHDDPEKIQRVKDLYEELLIPQTYAVYEEESYKIILTHIQQISSPLSHELFFKILGKIYRRNA